MSQPAMPPVDQCNQLLGEVPSVMSTALIETPAGQRMALTIRTASTTLTVLLNDADAMEWASNLSSTAAKMSAAGLIVANGHLNGQVHG